MLAPWVQVPPSHEHVLLHRLFANHMRHFQLKELEDSKCISSKHADWSSRQISQAEHQAGRTRHN